MLSSFRAWTWLQLRCISPVVVAPVGQCFDYVIIWFFVLFVAFYATFCFVLYLICASYLWSLSISYLLLRIIPSAFAFGTSQSIYIAFSFHFSSSILGWSLQRIAVTSGSNFFILFFILLQNHTWTWSLSSDSFLFVFISLVVGRNCSSLWLVLFISLDVASLVVSGLDNSSS